MKRSRDAESLLKQYRQASLPSVEARARVLRELVQRAASGEVPNISSTPAPPPAVPLAGATAPAGGSALMVATIVASSALVLTGAAWLWRGRDARPAPVAQTQATAIVAREGRGPLAASHVRPALEGNALEQGNSLPQATYGQHTLDHNAAEPSAGTSEPPAKALRATRAPASRSRTEDGVHARRGTRGAAALGAPNPREGRSQDLQREASDTRDPTVGESAMNEGATRESDAHAAARVPAGEAPAAGRVATSASMATDAPNLPARTGLEEELRLLRAAYEALREGRPAGALEALAEHAARFPRGDLAEPRQVARIMALCQSGRRDLARAEAARFLEQSPRSPHAARVRSLCE